MSKIKFPAWVDKGSTAARAQNVLKYLVNRLAAEASPKSSVSYLGREIGMAPATMFVYLNRGYFSQEAAEKLQARFGKNLAPSALLQDPSLAL